MQVGISSRANTILILILILREMREREEVEAREITLYSSLLQRGKELKFNFRVNLIWVGWVNFNLGGVFFLIWIGLFLNGYTMLYPSCDYYKIICQLKIVHVIIPLATCIVNGD